MVFKIFWVLLVGISKLLEEGCRRCWVFGEGDGERLGVVGVLVWEIGDRVDGDSM